MLLIVDAIKLVVEIALLSLAGQFVLGLLAGAKREQNVVYRVFQVLTNPFVKGMRRITPRAVIDRHVPLATFLFLLMVWVIVTITKISLCIEIGIEKCR